MKRADANHKSNQPNPTSLAHKAVKDNRSVQLGEPKVAAGSRPKAVTQTKA